MFDPNNPFRKGDSLVDAVRSILSGKPIEEKKMDPVDQKALKGKHSDRKDKDIDNDGDVDDSDEYLHKRRQAISKAMKESEDEMDDEDDDEEEENGKKKKLSGKKDEVDTKPSMDDQKMASEMSDAQMKKREEIVKSMKKKMPDFKKRYGDRAKDVMYATATKMAMKEGFELTEEDFEELDEAKFSAKEIKMAIGIASDPRYKGGKMTGAAQAIDKIKPGLSDHPQVRAVLQRVNEAPEDMEPASPDEGSMALDQLKFMSYAANKMMEHIQGGGEFPEWMQNKLSGTFEKMKSLYANIEHGEMKEGFELTEEDFEELDEAKVTKKMIDDLEDRNEHGMVALKLAQAYGTAAEVKKVQDINKRHNQRGHIEYKDQKERDVIIRKYYKMAEEADLDEATYSYKAATFNGNVVKGTGSTKEAARKDAEKKAKALGSTIRKRLPEEVDLEGK